MKKLLTLALCALLLSGLIPQTAQAKDNLEVTFLKEFRYADPDDRVAAYTIKNNSDRDVFVTVVTYDEAARRNVDTHQFPVAMGTDIPLLTWVYKRLSRNGEINTYRYTITSDGGYKKVLYYAQKLTITKDAYGNEVHTYEQMDNSFYPRNTVSAMGPHFRDVTPNLTKLWYMFTPIDLSIQGRQTFPLVASNIFEVGQVHVDVNMDTVIVSYEMFFEDKPGFTTQRLSDFLTFYNSYSDVTIVEPEDMKEPSMFAFNQPFSILNHLGGDTNVLMFVRNRITYFEFPTPKIGYTRYWRNKPDYKARIEGMLQMMDPIMTVDGGGK